MAELSTEIEEGCAHQILNLLQAPSEPLPKFSFLKSGPIVYYAHYARKSAEPSSSILRLIQGIYTIAPDQARKILRNRIFSTEKPTELCFGAVKVAAKRLTAPIAPKPHPTSLNLEFIEVSPIFSQTAHPSPHLLRKSLPSNPFSHADFLDLAKQLTQAVPRKGPRYTCDRDIAALLVSEKGEILASALNTNAIQRTLHAEINLIQKYFEQTGNPIPRGAKIFVTLKPCKMCAGALWTCSEDPLSLEVYYSQFDSGRNARWTILDAGSAERKRANTRDSDIAAVIQFQLNQSNE